jgi:hypothetical protein
LGVNCCTCCALCYQHVSINTTSIEENRSIEAKWLFDWAVSSQYLLYKTKNGERVLVMLCLILVLQIMKLRVINCFSKTSVFHQKWVIFLSSFIR